MRRRKSVLFIFGLDGPWKRYRCDHQAEQLELLGRSCDVVTRQGFDFLGAIDDYEVFVLYRVRWDGEVERFVEHARSVGKEVIFDTDDLVFEPSLTRHLSFIDRWPEEDRRKQTATFAALQKTLLACRRAVVSTVPLAAHARRHVERVDVAPNAVSEEVVRRADRVLAGRARGEKSNGAITIGYFSGTGTHDRDFLEAADAVLWALETYPEARFLCVGKLILDERFDGWGPRVVRMPLQPWEKLPKLLATVDVNLAPLERDNPIAECKSCVKYLEAALVGVPTIASPRPDFTRVIEHGNNGLLADQPAEWQAALEALIASPELRGEIALRATEDVREHHTTAKRAALFGEVLGSAKQAPSDTEQHARPVP